MLYKIGVTGNICSGKSSCVKFLSNLPNSFGLNYDEFGHTVYQRNFLFLNQIKTIFLPHNKNIFLNENTLFEKFVRKELGNVVFNVGKNKLQILNSLIRPEMRELLNLHIRKIEYNLKRENKKAILFVEGALIIEGNSVSLFDEIWLTKASKEEVEKRFEQRLEENKTKEYSQSILENILKSQMNEEEKSKFCSEVIDTSGKKEVTREKYKELYSKLVKKLILE